MNDWKQFLQAARQRGWEISQSGGSHLKLRRPGHRMVILPSTPGRARSIDNSRAQLEREERRAAAITELAASDPEELDERYQDYVDRAFEARADRLS